jgi:hypothetical protein
MKIAVFQQVMHELRESIPPGDGIGSRFCDKTTRIVGKLLAAVDRRRARPIDVDQLHDLSNFVSVEVTGHGRGCGGKGGRA